LSVNSLDAYATAATRVIKHMIAANLNYTLARPTVGISHSSSSRSPGSDSGTYIHGLNRETRVDRVCYLAFYDLSNRGNNVSPYVPPPRTCSNPQVLTHVLRLRLWNYNSTERTIDQHKSPDECEYLGRTVKRSLLVRTSTIAF
jgi:hypothetical protein